jgi:apolipoprotein N-acyltransferase
MTWWLRERLGRPWADIVLIGLSALFLILIFSEPKLHFLAWIALIPVLVLSRQSAPFRVFLYFLIMGFLFMFGLHWWAIKVKGFNILNLSLAVFCSALFFGFFGICAFYFQQRIPRWSVLSLPTLWVLLEYVRTHIGFLSWPWGILGYSQYTVLPVAQIAAFTGIYGVSFLLVSVNTLLADILHFSLFHVHVKNHQSANLKSHFQTLLTFFAGAGFLFFGTFLFGLSSAAEDKQNAVVQVALIQGNDSWDEKAYLNYRDYLKTTFQTYSLLTREAVDMHPELIVWPASSVPGRIPQDRALVRRLGSLAQESSAFLLVGSSGYEKFSRTKRKEKGIANSAFLFAPDGSIAGRYDKIMLVPFDEYLPLRGHVRWPSWIAPSGMTDFRSGTELSIFSLKNLTFGVQICWENLFPNLFRKMAARGVDFMVSMTNEAALEDPAPHYQMLAMNVFRAIENHVSIVRTTPTGVSALIGSKGKIISRIQDDSANDVRVQGYLSGDIPLTAERSFYNQYGDWFVYELLIAFCGFALLSLSRGKG